MHIYQVTLNNVLFQLGRSTCRPAARKITWAHYIVELGISGKINYCDRFIT